MSAAIIVPEAADVLGTSVSAPIRRQRFGTLVRVELRKMTNTRSGRVLLIIIVALAAAVLGWKVAHANDWPVTFENYNMATSLSVGFVLPVIGLPAMTSEWSQRTALTTFTLSPRRLRVFVAKLIAALALSAAVLVVTIAMTLGATALGAAVSGRPASYDGLSGDIRATIVTTLAQVLMAASFGALISMTAVAVGAFIAAPTVWASAAPSLLGRSSRWLDIFATYDRLFSQQATSHWPQSLTSAAVWIVLPMTVGLARNVRREVK